METQLSHSTTINKPRRAIKCQTFVFALTYRPGEDPPRQGEKKNKKADVSLVRPIHCSVVCSHAAHLSGSCLRTRSSDFTTATVMDGKSEPPAGIWRFLISQTEKGKQVGGGARVRDEAQSKEMLNCQGTLKRKKAAVAPWLRVKLASSRLCPVSFFFFLTGVPEPTSVPSTSVADAQGDNVRLICGERAERQTCLPWLALAASRLGFPRSY